MEDFERVAFNEKRTALLNLVQKVASRFSEDFRFYEVPKESFLNFNSRLERKEIQENSSGQVRHIDVFWDGPVDSNTTELQNIQGLFRQGNLQYGVIDSFTVSINFGVSYDSNGEIENRSDFEDFLASYKPKGIFPTLRETEAIEDVGGSGKTVLLSMPTNVTIPPMPRPLEKSGKERAHYADFRVLITDL